MNKVSAFVARGFTPSDEPVWNVVRAHLDRLRQSTKWFDFEDGESNEGRLVGEKIRERILRNKIFIGLFTRRELFSGRTVESNFSNRLKLAVSMLCEASRYSTSTWALQESGYAIAKDRKLFLMIEEGVDDFPKLQDNLEYISFSRATLQVDLNKLTTMLLAYQAEGSDESQPTQNAEATSSKEDAPSNEASLDKSRSYIREVVAVLIEKKDFAAGRALMEKEAAIEHDSEKKIEIQAGFYSLCCRFGIERDKSLEQLQAIARDNPQSSRAQSALARGYDSFESYDVAAGHFKKAAELASDKAREADLRFEAIISLGMGGKFPDAVELAMTSLARFDNPKDKARIYEALGNTYLRAGNKVIALACWEESVRLFPSAASLRFKLGLHYEEVGVHSLSVHHYEKANTDDATTLNNLGVAFDRLRIGGMAHEKYAESAKLGESLAMANLALGYLDAGFLSEADGLIKKARVLESPHENVGKAMSKLAQTRKDESEKYEGIKKRAQLESGFGSEFGQAVGRSNLPDSWTGLWRFRLGSISLRREGNSVFGTGELATTSPLMDLIAGAAAPIQTLKLDLSGTIYGEAVEYTFTQKKEGGRTSLLSSAGISLKGRAYIRTAGVVETVEYDSDMVPNFFTATKQSAA